MSVPSCFANVVIDLAAHTVRDKLFTYRIPQALTQSALPGVCVLVPFGNKQAIAGYIISLSQQPPESLSQDHIEIKDILTVLDPIPFFNEQYIDFLKWTANYYCTSLMDILTAAPPTSFSAHLKQNIRLKMANDSQPKIEGGALAIVKLLQQTKAGQLSLTALKQRWKKLTRHKESQFYLALNKLAANQIVERINKVNPASKTKSLSIITWTGKDPLKPKEEQIVELLKTNSGQLPISELINKAKTTKQTIYRLIESGLLAFDMQDQTRDPLKHLHNKPTSDKVLLELTSDQENVLSILSKVLGEQLKTPAPDTSPATQPWLLHGVTGSGKTEIYLRLIDQALKENRSSLLMVPEIALTPQLAHRLVERFGKQVAIWHSGLSNGERYDTWQRLQRLDVKILLGARSAVLVDIPKLGLIIVDEEHDGSYKQTSPPPRYNAKTLAVEKARRNQALVVFGSATPDIATYYLAEKQKQVLALPKRVFGQNFPDSIFVDMRKEFAAGNRSIFSRLLGDTLSNILDKGEQAILLINRRGYANHVFCRACGYVSSCKNCSVAMVYHRNGSLPNNSQESGHLIYHPGYLICHHCGYQAQITSICPSCQGPFLKHSGLGTQKAEMDLKDLLPQAKIVRLDSDTVQRKGAHEHIFQQFSSGKANVLIGTQMVAKGLDNENVTLVGILAADTAFNLPDYRSTERGFQLLTQVAGRAGRGRLAGTVILQTFNPQLPALKLSQKHDYQNFYLSELSARQTYSYPPFSQLIRLVIASHDAHETQIFAEKIAEALSNYLADLLPPSSIEILGPAPCILEKLHGKYRQHLIVKNNAAELGQNLVSSFFKNKSIKEGIQLAIDIDAIDLL